MSPLREDRVKHDYRCSQIVLYSALDTAWQSYLKFQAQFYEYSRRYTVEHGEQQLAAVKAAMRLPSRELRSGKHKLLRTKLIPAAEECLVMWMYLQGHIMKAFPKIEWKAHLEAAGSGHYRGSLERDWDSIAALMLAGTKFIEEKIIPLKEGGMPYEFEHKFDEVRDRFDSIHLQYEAARARVWGLCEDKIKANNAVFREASAMLRDGQKIFRYDEAVRKRFYFNKILELIRGGDGV